MIQANPTTVFISASDITISINPTSQYVKITHKPTGIVSKCQRYNSSHKNKIEAMLSLREMLSNLMHQSTPSKGRYQ